MIYVLFIIVSMLEGPVLSGFISQPQNISVVEGSEARFGCIYDRSPFIPSWNINGTIYVWSSLPEKHTYNGHQLIVQDVDIFQNGSTYQCFIPGVAQSSVGLLIVITQPTNFDTSIAGTTIIIVPSMPYSSSTCYTPSGTSSISLVNIAQTIATTGPDVKSFQENRITAGVVMAAIGGALGLIIISTTFAIVIFLCKYYNKKSQLQETDVDIDLSRNDAYECPSHHRIRMISNLSYEVHKVK